MGEGLSYVPTIYDSLTSWGQRRKWGMEREGTEKEGERTGCVPYLPQDSFHGVYTEAKPLVGESVLWCTVACDVIGCSVVTSSNSLLHCIQLLVYEPRSTTACMSSITHAWSEYTLAWPAVWRNNLAVPWISRSHHRLNARKHLRAVFTTDSADNQSDSIRFSGDLSRSRILSCNLNIA